MIDVEQLDSRLMRRMPEFGMTRLADTTGMDRIGIDTASVVRPGTRDVIWVYSGKGTSRAQARVSAIMEGLERTCALWPDDPETVLTVRRPGSECWLPERFTEPKRDEHGPIPWVRGFVLADRRPVWLPADLVFTGHRPPRMAAGGPFAVRTSNGLGAAFDLDSAIAHALLEIAERDIVSHHELIASHAGVAFLAAVATTAGIETGWLAHEYRDDVSHSVTVEIDSLPKSAQALAEKFQRAGLTLVIKALPNDFGLATFGAACLEHVTMAGVLACAGYTTRCDPEDALVGAILELAQTRATDLQGAREDRHEIEKRRLAALPSGHWLATPGPAVTFATACNLFAPPTGGTVLAQVLMAFDRAGLPEAATVAFPAPDGIYAVRAVVPGAETWHATGGLSHLGPRLAKKINRG